MQQSTSLRKTITAPKNIEVNGRFAGCCYFEIEGDFGKRMESSIYYKIGLDIRDSLSGFEVGDKIVFSIENEFDFWKRVQLKATSSSGKELFCFKWIMGNEVLQKGIFKKSCFSNTGKREFLSLECARESNVFPKEKRTIVLFNTIHREQSSYGDRPLLSDILRKLEDILVKRFVERKYATPFFVLDLPTICLNDPTNREEKYIRDYYVKHGYSVHDERFLKKLPNEENALDVKEHVDFFTTIDNMENNEVLQRRGEHITQKDIVPELFKWGDIVEIIDNGRDFLLSAISRNELGKVVKGLRGFVLCDERKDDCGMITCSFEKMESLYIKIHYSHLKKVSALTNS